jgi:transcriptional regulator with XRE-family HTH domain
MNHLQMIGKNIQAFRKLRNLTQDELAKKAKMHRAYIGFLERGEKNLSVESLFTIADALQVAPYLLLYPEMKDWISR